MTMRSRRSMRVLLLPVIMLFPAKAALADGETCNGVSQSWPMLGVLDYATGFAAAGDFNGDGREDFVLGTCQGSGVEIVLSGDDGYVAVPLMGAIRGGSFLAADIDGDGDLDAVAAGPFGQRIEYWFGRGDGTFEESVFYDYSLSVAQGACSVLTTNMAVSDIDNDGVRELLVLGNVAVAPGNGRQMFFVPLGPDGPGPVDAVRFSQRWDRVYTGIRATHVLDADADGDLDVLFYDTDRWMVVRNVLGVFGIPELFAEVPWDNSRDAVLDVDGNGFPDVVRAFDRSSIEAFLMYANGLVEQQLIDFGSFVFSGNLQVVDAGDLDGDGLHDIAVGNIDEPDSVLSVVADVLGEARLERVFSIGRVESVVAMGRTNSSTSGIFVIQGGQFGVEPLVAYELVASQQGGVSLLGVRNQQIEIGEHLLAFDIDADGVEELLVTTRYNFENRILQLDVEGGLEDVGVFGSRKANARSHLGDMNGDGHLDLIQFGYGGIDPGAIHVSLGDGEMLGEPITWDSIFRREAYLAVADVDNDGCSEVVFSVQFSNQNWIVRLDEDGVLRSQPVDTGFQGRSIATVDQDGDGLPDLVTDDWRKGNTYVFLNLGGNSFGEGELLLSDFAAIWDATGDLDGDGLQDFVLLSESKESDPPFERFSEIAVLWGSASGGVGPPHRISTDMFGFETIAIADADGDGLRDLVLTTLAGDSRVMLQQLGRVFTEPIQTLGYRSVSVTGVDLAGDGIQDLVFLSALTQSVTTLMQDDLRSCAGDLAEPFGVLNFFDVAAFIGLYNAGDSSADFAAPLGVLNFFDVAAFLNLFANGCP